MTHLVAIFSIQCIYLFVVNKEISSMSARSKAISAKIQKGHYPSDKETLQDAVGFIFGSDNDQMKEMASRVRARFFQAAIAGAIGSGFLYYLLLNHHI